MEKTIFSQRLDRLSESATLAMARKSRELQAQGLDVISLSLGEPDFNTPDYIKNAAIQAINENHSHYMPVAGYLDLREVICEKLKIDNHLSFTPEQIVVSNGAKQSIANVCLALLNKGDEVLIPAPYWVTYKEIVHLCGATPIVIPPAYDNNFEFTETHLAPYCTSKTKLLIYSSPSNPSGTILSKKSLESIKNFLLKNPNIITISDEIYEYIRYKKDHFSLAQFTEIKDRVVVINGVSKSFAMTGWRIGYMAASLEIAQACNKIQGQLTSGASSIAQKAAKVGIQGLSAPVKTMIDAFEERRDFAFKRLMQIKGIQCFNPDGAFYLFPNCEAFIGKRYGEWDIKNSQDLCEYILQEALVALVDGDSFGAPACLRISYASSMENLIEAFNRIENALLKLK